MVFHSELWPSVYLLLSRKVYLSTCTLMCTSSPKLGQTPYMPTTFSEISVVGYWRQHRLGIKVVGIFNTFGPRYGFLVSNFVRQALRSEHITIYGSPPMSPAIRVIARASRGNSQGNIEKQQLLCRAPFHYCAFIT